MSARCADIAAERALGATPAIRMRTPNRGGRRRQHGAMARCLVRCAHAAKIELGLIAFLYLLYQVGRGAVGDAFAEAQLHAHEIVAFERSLGLFWEGAVQEAVETVPALARLLSISYLSLHIAATTTALVWLYRRHPASYAIARTTLVVGTAIALAIHVAFPTAPPRLAEIGIADTVATAGGVDLGSDLIGPFYNPIAAVPSMHFGYALLVGFFVAARGRRAPVRILGALYPGFVLFVIVATGNHFLFDAVAGGAVIVAAGCLARLATRLRPNRDDGKTLGPLLGFPPDAKTSPAAGQ
jgi:hypothetical protein